MLPQLTRLKGMALDVLFPQRCVGCGREGDFLCQSCLQTLPRIVPPICPKCGQPQASGILCPDCSGWQAHIDGIRSPFRFDGIIRQAIHQLKYRNLRALATPLASFLQAYLAASPIPDGILVPVPMHPKRLRERGYNQSSLLARELGKLSGRPVVADCLIREQYTPPQARTASRAERQHNVAHVFTCRDQGLYNQPVLLVDDVATSGATVDACAAALKSAGVIRVWALVLAREIREMRPA